MKRLIWSLVMLGGTFGVLSMSPASATAGVFCQEKECWRDAMCSPECPPCTSESIIWPGVCWDFDN